MWVIKSILGYIEGVYVGNHINPVLVKCTQERDDAKQFETRQEAKDFMAKYSITGSVIPY